MKNLIYKSWSLLLIAAMVLAGIGMPVRMADAAEGWARRYGYDGYAVVFEVTNAWNGGFNATVRVENTGNASIRDWSLTFPLDYAILDIWNATITEHADGGYTVRNNVWNADIRPGESVFFGLTAACMGTVSFPEAFVLNRAGEGTERASFSASYVSYSDWGTGCNGEIILSNTSDDMLEAWELSFDYGREIVSISNAIIVSHEGTRYVICNAGYNADIAAGEAVHIGIVAGEGSRDEIPHGFFMGEDGGNGEPEVPEEPGTENEEEVLMFLVGDYNAKANSIDMEWYTNAEDSEVTVWSSGDNAVYEVEAVVSEESSYSYQITDEFDIKYFKASVTDEKGRVWESIPFFVVRTEDGYSVELFDSDGDGLPDEYEWIFGTDVDVADTDGDGLSDSEEVYFTGTDPVVYDSVEEGISDADADTDGDGLSNREELECGTNAVKPDTDGDGLSDSEELYLYDTNPVDEDTDGGYD